MHACMYVDVYIYIYIYIHTYICITNTPNPPTKIIPAKIRRLNMSGKYPMETPHKFKILLESNLRIPES